MEVLERTIRAHERHRERKKLFEFGFTLCEQKSMRVSIAETMLEEVDNVGDDTFGYGGEIHGLVVDQASQPHTCEFVE